VPGDHTIGIKYKTNERTRILANWDPSYLDEKVDWYSEFIHRSAPIAVNWLQQPRNRENVDHEPMEIRGAGVYNPPGENEASMLVGPLDDGSICIWDASGPPGQRGRIVSRSAAHTLSPSGSTSDVSRSRMINTGVTECISVDNHSKRAYIAVQCGKWPLFHILSLRLICYCSLTSSQAYARKFSVLRLAISLHTLLS
jgi:hypothetical protein